MLLFYKQTGRVAYAVVGVGVELCKVVSHMVGSWTPYLQKQTIENCLVGCFGLPIALRISRCGHVLLDAILLEKLRQIFTHGLRAVVSDHGLRVVVSDHGLRAVVSDHRLRAVVSDNGLGMPN
ncbi:hypothetical protein ACFX2J_001239 [Malus domestica]